MSQSRKTYSFKSVGQLDTSLEQQAIDTVVKTPIGIVTPIAFSAGGSSTLFEMNYDIAQQIRDNLKNLILTNSGERLMLTDFGANIRPLATEITKDDTATEAIRRISKTVSKYMPFIELETFETRVGETLNGITIRVIVTVNYSIPSIGATNQSVEAIIDTIG